MLASFSIVPMGVGEELKDFIAEIINVIDKSGLDYKLGAMQTTVEGDLEAVMPLILKCHQLMKEKAPRVLTSITIDDRKDAINRLEGKVKDVESILKREMHHE